MATDAAVAVVPDRTLRIKHLLLLALIICTALSLRWYKLASASMWMDEFLSLQVSSGHGYDQLNLPVGKILDAPPSITDLSTAGSWGDLIVSMRRSTHPPLYFCVLRVWRHLFAGDTDRSLRGLSVAVSLVAMLFAFDAVRTLRRTSAALWSAALLAVASPQIQYAQEARGYAMLVMFMFAGCAALVRIEMHGATKRRWIALFASVSAMVMTHYLGYAIGAAMLIFALIRLRGAEQRAAVGSLLVAMLGMFALWSPIMLVQAKLFEQNLAWMHESPGGHVWRTLERAAALPVKFFFEPGMKPGPSVYGSAALFVLPLIVIRKRPELLLWYLIMITVVIVIALGDMVRSSTGLSHMRYTVAAAAAGNVLIAVLIESYRGRWRTFAPALPVLACTLALPLSYARLKPDWRAPADYLHNYCRGDSTIVYFVMPGADWRTGVFHVGVKHYAEELDRPFVLLGNRADPKLLGELAMRGGIVDVFSGSSPAQEVLPGCTIREQTWFPFIGFCARVELPAPPVAVAGGASSTLSTHEQRVIQSILGRLD